LQLHITTLQAAVKLGRAADDVADFESIGNINTLFSLFQQVKNDINDTVQPWAMNSCGQL